VVARRRGASLQDSARVPATTAEYRVADVHGLTSLIRWLVSSVRAQVGAQVATSSCRLRLPSRSRNLSRSAESCPRHPAPHWRHLQARWPATHSRDRQVPDTTRVPLTPRTMNLNTPVSVGAPERTPVPDPTSRRKARTDSRCHATAPGAPAGAGVRVANAEVCCAVTAMSI